MTFPPTPVTTAPPATHAPTPPSLGEDLRLDHREAGQSASTYLWWTHVPTLPGEKIGVLGHFSADGPEATTALLKKAELTLVAHGCTLAVGPMDGNTWCRYRFVTEPGTEPAFFLEPTNPPQWPGWWLSSGYSQLATYTSTVTEDLRHEDPRVATVAARLSAAGISLRPLALANFKEDLTHIYDVSIESFQENFLYTPLSTDAFLAQYLPLQARVVPHLILIAEHASRPVGYVFAMPDFAQATPSEFGVRPSGRSDLDPQNGLKPGLHTQPSEFGVRHSGRPNPNTEPRLQKAPPSTAIDTLIVKTLAVRPGRAYAGLGAWLLAEVHRSARQLGYTRAIHALMHESNRSKNLSAHYAQPLRRYALFSKKLS